MLAFHIFLDIFVRHFKLEMYDHYTIALEDFINFVSGEAANANALAEGEPSRNFDHEKGMGVSLPDCELRQPGASILLFNLNGF